MLIDWSKDNYQFMVGHYYWSTFLNKKNQTFQRIIFVDSLDLQAITFVRIEKWIFFLYINLEERDSVHTINTVSNWLMFLTLCAKKKKSKKKFRN